MGAIETARDALFGNPPNAAQEPSREGLLAAITELANGIANATLGTLLAATFDTLANANLDLDYPEGAVALIYDDTENDLAVKSGASGSGAWTLTTIFRNSVDSMALPYVDLARDWAAKETGEVDPDNHPGELSALQYAEAADTARAAAVAAVTGLNNAVVTAFPLDRYEEPVSLRVEDVNTTTNLVTADASGITIANGGRLLVTPAIASLGLAVGDTIRIEFERISGTETFPSFTFQNGSSLVSTVDFAQLGNRFIGEAVIPASTTATWIDRTNGSGGATVITVPRYAKKRAVSALPIAQRTRLNNIAADPGEMSNLWLSTTEAILATGSGSPTLNADGSVDVPAGAFAEIRSPNLSTPIAVGAAFTFLMRVSSPLVRQADIRFTGNLGGGATTVALRPVGDGWWCYSGVIPTLANSSTTAVSMVARVDNRAPLETALYTAATVTASDFILVAGANLPWRRLAAGAVPLATQIAAQIETTGRTLFGISLGDQFNSAIKIRSLAAEATALGELGLTVPNGSTGQGSLLQVAIEEETSTQIGRTVRFILGFDQSATFTRNLSRFIQVRLANLSDVTRSATISQSIVGNRRFVTIDYVIQGDEIQLKPAVQIAASAATAADETLALTSVQYFWLTAVGDTSTVADQMLLERLSDAAKVAQGYASVPAATRFMRRTVAASGGDFTTVTAALAGIARPIAMGRVCVDIAPGRYMTDEIYDVDWIDLKGASPRDVILDGSQSNSATETEIAAKSVMLLRSHTRIEGVAAWMKNGRYAIHLESGGNYPNRAQEIIGCDIRHFGNDDADFPAAWTAQIAIGSGLSSGQSVTLKGNYIWSKNSGGFSYHTNRLFSEPSFVNIEGNTIVTDATNPGAFSISILPYGSFQQDKCRIVGNVLGGNIIYKPSFWLPTLLAQQPANHAEIDVYGYGNTPAVFVNTDFGRALRIDSATTGASSSVAVSGTAVKAIFGDGLTDRLYTVAGSPGFVGHVYGWGDISGTGVGLSSNVFITSLGQRLGDCTSVNKTLSVVVDGGAPIVITFDQNYTAQSNATILASVNSALGSAAVASEFAVGQRYRPRFTDEEFSPVNSSGSGIVMGSVLAFDADHQSVRLMTSADAASRFAGVAWQDIPAGTRGRVKNKGFLPITDVLRTDGAAFAFGDTFSIDAGAPGRVFKGGSQGLLTAIRSDAVRLA